MAASTPKWRALATRKKAWLRNPRTLRIAIKILRALVAVARIFDLFG